MAWGNFVLEKGFDTDSALTKFRMVTFGTDPETVTAVTAIDDVPIGVAQFSVSADELAKGKGASVRVIGISEVEAAGAIDLGERCQLENDGRVSAEVGSSGKRLVGLCVGTPSTNAGDRIAMLIIHGLEVA